MKWSGIQQGAARAKAESNAISQDEQSEESSRERQTTAQRQKNGHTFISPRWGVIGRQSEGSSASLFRQESTPEE